MCLAQGPQPSDAGMARTHSPLVLSQTLCHWAPSLSEMMCRINDSATQIQSQGHTSKSWNYL